MLVAFTNQSKLITSKGVTQWGQCVVQQVKVYMPSSDNTVTIRI